MFQDTGKLSKENRIEVENPRPLENSSLSKTKAKEKIKQGHFPQNHGASKGTKRDDITYQSLQTKELVLPPYLFSPITN